MLLMHPCYHKNMRIRRQRYIPILLATCVAATGITQPAYASSPIAATAITTESRQAIATAATHGAITQALTRFLTQYAITVQTDCTGLKTALCQPVTDASLEQYRPAANAFVSEWAKYKPAWIAHFNVHSIRFVSGLTMSTVTDDSFKRAATPSPDSASMVYDIAYDADYLRGVYHHEFAHYVAYKRYGDYYYKDPAWETFNPPGFSYGNGGASCYTNGTCNTSRNHPATGFATGYAMSGLEEDMAEVYSFLFEQHMYTILMDWAKSDPYLAKKVTYLKQYIQSVDPAMNEAYFENDYTPSDVPVMPKPTATQAAPNNSVQKSPLPMAVIATYAIGIGVVVLGAFAAMTAVILVRKKSNRT